MTIGTDANTIICLQRALHESQYARDKLTEENKRLKAVVNKHDGWEALGDESHGCTIVCTEGAYEVPWIAIFAEPFRAEQYAEWRRSVKLPECEGVDQEEYTVYCMTLEGRVNAADVAFWNSSGDAPTDPHPTVSDVLGDRSGQSAHALIAHVKHAKQTTLDTLEKTHNLETDNAYKPGPPDE